MGLQWLIVEKKALLYNSQKHGFFTSVKRHFTLCPVDTQRKTKWRLPANARKHPLYTDISTPECKVFGENICNFFEASQKQRFHRPNK